PSISAGKCCARASNRCPLIPRASRPRRMSIRRDAPKPSPSAALLPWPANWPIYETKSGIRPNKRRTRMALMRRQSLVKFDAPLCETIVETPKPQGREVLLRIERCGLCHSDLHIQDGYADIGGGKRLDTTRGMKLPFTLGHE